MLLLMLRNSFTVLLAMEDKATIFHTLLTSRTLNDPFNMFKNLVSIISVILEASSFHPLSVVLVVFFQSWKEFLPFFNIPLMCGSSWKSGIHNSSTVFLYQSAFLLDGYFWCTLHHPEETDRAIFHSIFIKHRFGCSVIGLLVFIETLVERCLSASNVALVAFYASGIFSNDHVKSVYRHWGDCRMSGGDF
jgi:hypothetical protein